MQFYISWLMTLYIHKYTHTHTRNAMCLGWCLCVCVSICGKTISYVDFIRFLFGFVQFSLYYIQSMKHVVHSGIVRIQPNDTLTTTTNATRSRSFSRANRVLCVSFHAKCMKTGLFSRNTLYKRSSIRERKWKHILLKSIRCWEHNNSNISSNSNRRWRRRQPEKMKR